MISHKKALWVDVAKGITICLMVIGHSSIPNWLSSWIWAFHMPFFFFISALFTSWRNDKFVPFVVRKSKSLLYPFIIYSIINLVAFSFITNIPFAMYLKQVLREGWGGVALWFIPVIYISTLICKCISTVNAAYYYSAILLVVGYLFSYFDINLPWALSSVPFASVIMIVTRFNSVAIKRTITRYADNNYICFITLIVSAIAVFIVSHYGRLDMASNEIRPILPISLGAISGIICIVSVSLLITRYLPNISRIVKVIGQNTYEVLAFSQVIIVMLNEYFKELVLLKYSLLVVILMGIIFIRKIVGRYLVC